MVSEGDDGQTQEMGHYEGIIRSISEVAYLLDSNQHIAYTNRSSLEHADVSLAEIRGGHVLDLIERVAADDESPARFERTLETVYDESADVEFPVTVDIELDATSGTITREYRCSPCETGALVVSAEAVERNRVDRQQRERRLKRLQERIDLAVEGAGIGTWDWDIRTDEVVFNDAWATMLGYTREELDFDFRIWEQLVHPVDLEAATAALEAHMAGETEVYESEIRMQTKSGTWKWVWTIGQVAERNENGDPVRAAGIHIDIDDRKQAELDLARSERRFEAVFNDPEMLVGVLDTEGVVRQVNETALESVPVSSAQLEGTPFPETLWWTHDEAVRNDIQQRVERATDGEYVAFEAEANTTDDEQMTLSGSLRPVTDDGGGVVAVVVSARDITERRQRERELQATKQELAQSNEKLEQFAYVASHDLQEPLRMVSSYVELLELELGDELDAETQEYMAFATEGADRMQAMIDGLLQYSRVQTDGNPFEMVDSDTVLDEILQNLELKISESGVDIERESLPTVTADRTQLGQVFQNLLKNAIEHGDEDSVVELRATNRDGVTEFAVADNGSGIPERRQDDIFDIFDKGGDSDGTGIGLAVCQQVVERHGGDIWVDSTEGDGTTVRFTIPERSG